jgi:putative ABC transport system ATP-binding protein
VTGPGAGGQGPRLRLEQVTVELGGRTVLHAVDLVAEAGAPVGLTGPSGAGKTVLCLVLAGVLAPTRGRVELDGLPDTGDPHGAIVLQHHGLVAGLTAEENVALPLQARRLPRRDVEDRVASALGALGLAAHGGRMVDELSGGEQQRVGIARALAGDPAVLVADEPTSELDPENRARVLSLLESQAAAGRIVVVASDDPEVIGVMARVVELLDGSVVPPS